MLRSVGQTESRQLKTTVFSGAVLLPVFCLIGIVFQSYTMSTRLSKREHLALVKQAVSYDGCHSCDPINGRQFKFN